MILFHFDSFENYPKSYNKTNYLQLDMRSESERSFIKQRSLDCGQEQDFWCINFIFSLTDPTLWKCPFVIMGPFGQEGDFCNAVLFHLLSQVLFLVTLS